MLCNVLLQLFVRGEVVWGQPLSQMLQRIDKELLWILKSRLGYELSKNWRDTCTVFKGPISDGKMWGESRDKAIRLRV